MALLSNIQLWNYIRKNNPNFASHTAEGTKELFTERGFEALKNDDITALNDFFTLSMRVAFQKVDIAKVRNPFSDSGLIEYYDTPNGGFVQRVAVESVKGVSPAYRNLEDGDSVDPFVVRKPKSGERFFSQNYDWQSLITVQEFQLKTIFLAEYGVSQYVAGILQGLENGYIVQDYANALEALNAAINSTDYPLQDSQKIALGDWDGDNPTDEQLLGLIVALKDVATMMSVVASTDAFNAYKFRTIYDPSDMVLLMRAGIKTRIQTQLEVGAFNPDRLTIPFDIKEVENFGGLKPYKEASFETPLFEVYDKLGAVIGYAETEGATEATVAEGDAFFKDPNEKIVAVIAQKGLIFENAQNPMTVQPIYNPRGLYTNYIASRPGTAIVTDPLYALLTVSAPAD